MDVGRLLKGLSIRAQTWTMSPPASAEATVSDDEATVSDDKGNFHGPISGSIASCNAAGNAATSSRISTCELPDGPATDLQRSTARQEPGRPEIGIERFGIAGTRSVVGTSDAVQRGPGRLAKRPGVLTVLPRKRDVRRDWTFKTWHGSFLTSSREDSAPLRVGTTKWGRSAAQ